MMWRVRPAMNLQFRGDKILAGKALRGNAELRLGLLLGRFGDSVGRVTLRLSKAKGAGRPSAKRCEIIVGLKHKNVRVEHTDADLLVALDRAADKAVRSISRALDREREANPGRSRAALLVLETARVVAADQVLETARALATLRPHRAASVLDTARVLETARVLASEGVQATAQALKTPWTPKSSRLLETARVRAANRVLATASALRKRPR
jgi:ribosomal subunit interface protein